MCSGWREQSRVFSYSCGVVLARLFVCYVVVVRVPRVQFSGIFINANAMENYQVYVSDAYLTRECLCLWNMSERYSCEQLPLLQLDELIHEMDLICFHFIVSKINRS